MKKEHKVEILLDFENLLQDKGQKKKNSKNKPTLNIKHTSAIQDLRNNKEIVIPKADKSNIYFINFNEY